MSGDPAGAPVKGWDLWARAAELAADGVDAALATVVWRQAPSSGQIGARAIITADGRIEGWIGGACAEPVVIREAQQVIGSQQARLMFLGAAEAIGGVLPEGMVHVPMACQSEGALQVYVEPLVPSLDLLVVGRSPMCQVLATLAGALDWEVRVVEPADLSAADVRPRSVVVVATQGHGDEETVEAAVAARPLFVGLVASRRRGEALLAYLAERGTPAEHLSRVQTPVGLDLGHTTHAEIAVSVLAELVQRRAAGEFRGTGDRSGSADPATTSGPAQAIDPVCGMSVDAVPANRPFEHDGATYWFCCPPCHDAFAADPAAYLERRPDPHDVEA